MKSTLLLVALFGAICGFTIEDGPYYFNRMVAQDTADTVVQKFLARMTGAIESKNTVEISGLFQPGFIFKGCRGVYNKQQIVGLLSQIPAGTKFTFSLKSVLDNGISIRYTVSATGFAASAIEAEFVLNKVDQQLESGVVPACQKSHFLGFGAQDNAQVMIEKFLARMTRSIESKDTAIISGLFQPGFIFKGCKGVYNKQQIVGLLSQIPSGTKFTFSLKSILDNGVSIRYTVSATGFAASAIEAEFVLNKVDQQLESGVVPACQRSHFLGFGAQDNAQVMIEKFLARMTRSIESKDTAIISGLFQPGFIFKGCKGVYNKQQIVGLLSQIPSGTKFTFTLKSVLDNGVSIRYTVAATGFAASAIEAEFVLNKVDQQLESGVVPACQRSHFLGFGAQDNAQGMIEKFLARMTRSIASKDTAVISGLFQPGFIFKGCKGVYNKQQIVGLLSQIPADAKFTFTLKSVQDNGVSIKYTVSATGFAASAIEAEFVLNKGDQQLESGVVPACQQNHFHGLVLQDTAEDMTQKFLARMVKAVESNDASIISGLFDNAFVFKGCKGTYTKAQVVGMLSSLPSGTKFTFTLKSVKDNGATIKYTVLATGLGAPEIEADFVLDKLVQQLKSGNVPACQKTHQFFIPFGIIGRSAAQAQDPTAVVNAFLTSMKPIIASRDASRIGALFDDAFSFKGCRGTYNKAQAVQKIASIPSEASLDFELVSAQPGAPGQIEYIVSVAVPGMDKIQAQFVYCPERGVLKSGRIPQCPKSFY